MHILSEVFWFECMLVSKRALMAALLSVTKVHMPWTNCDRVHHVNASHFKHSNQGADSLMWPWHWSGQWVPQGHYVHLCQDHRLNILSLSHLFQKVAIQFSTEHIWHWSGQWVPCGHYVHLCQDHRLNILSLSHPFQKVAIQFSTVSTVFLEG